MRTKNGKYTGVIGEVLEIVAYALKATQKGTEFTLTASEIPRGTKTEKYLKQGGDFIVTTLKAVVEHKPLPFQFEIYSLDVRDYRTLHTQESPVRKMAFINSRVKSGTIERS